MITWFSAGARRARSLAVRLSFGLALLRLVAGQARAEEPPALAVVSAPAVGGPVVGVKVRKAAGAVRGAPRGRPRGGGRRTRGRSARALRRGARGRARGAGPGLRGRGGAPAHERDGAGQRAARRGAAPRGAPRARAGGGGRRGRARRGRARRGRARRARAGRGRGARRGAAPRRGARARRRGARARRRRDPARAGPRAAARAVRGRLSKRARRARSAGRQARQRGARLHVAHARDPARPRLDRRRSRVDALAAGPERDDGPLPGGVLRPGLRLDGAVREARHGCLSGRRGHGRRPAEQLEPDAVGRRERRGPPGHAARGGRRGVPGRRPLRRRRLAVPAPRELRLGAGERGRPRPARRPARRDGAGRSTRRTRLGRRLRGALPRPQRQPDLRPLRRSRRRRRLGPAARARAPHRDERLPSAPRRAGPGAHVPRRRSGGRGHLPHPVRPRLARHLARLRDAPAPQPLPRAAPRPRLHVERGPVDVPSTRSRSPPSRRASRASTSAFTATWRCGSAWPTTPSPTRTIFRTPPSPAMPSRPASPFDCEADETHETHPAEYRCDLRLERRARGAGRGLALRPRGLPVADADVREHLGQPERRGLGGVSPRRRHDHAHRDRASGRGRSVEGDLADERRLDR